MSKLTLVIGVCLLVSTTGCAYYDGYGYPNSSYYGRPAYYGYGHRPHYYGYGSDGYAYRWHRHHHRHRHHNYGFWQDR